MKVANPSSITVVAEDRASMDARLEAAVGELIDLAVGRIDQGILVARLRDDVCRISLSPSVPYGYTEEHDLRS